MRKLARRHGNTGELGLLASVMRREDLGQLPAAEFVIAVIGQLNTAMIIFWQNGCRSRDVHL